MSPIPLGILASSGFTLPTFVFRVSAATSVDSNGVDIDSLGNTFLGVSTSSADALLKINNDGSLNKAITVTNRLQPEFEISPYDNSIWDNQAATIVDRYDNNLTERTTYTFSVSGTALTISDVDFYPNGDFCISGRYTTTGNQIRAVVARVTAAGTVSWAREYSVSGNNGRIQSFYNCVVNPDTEDVFVLGKVGTSADTTTTQMVLARYNSTGTLSESTRYASFSTSSRFNAKFSNFWSNNKAHFSTRDFGTGNNNIIVISDGGTATSFKYLDNGATGLLQLGNEYANLQKRTTGSTGAVEIGVFNSSLTKIATHGISNFQDSGDLNIKEIGASDSSQRTIYAEQTR